VAAGPSASPFTTASAFSFYNKQAYYNKHASRANDLSIACLNAQSVGNKVTTISRTIVDHRIDVFVITKTWHENSESTSLKRIVSQDYRCSARPIPPGAANTANFQNHGGLAFVYSDVIKCRKITIMSVSTFEYLCGLMSTGAGHVVLLGVYRPGSQALTEAFFDKLSAVLKRLSTYNCPIVVCGDYNVHVDQPEDVNAVRLKQLLQSFDCRQHVTGPTHVNGHTLDLVITRTDTDISELRVGAMISDHALIRFTLCVKKSSVSSCQ